MAQTVNPKRVSFASVKNPVPYPDFLDIQIKSFKDFFQLETKSDERKNEGLYKTFSENFPITDTRNQFVLEFIDYFVDPPRYSIEECIERGLTYSVPLKARLKLYCTDPDHEDFETIVQDVYLGTIPYMTPSGTFVINGAERIVVSQLHRSPGVFFGQSFHANGTKLYSARIIPFKGSWIEFATDINNVMYAYIDRKKKLPLTTLLRAIGYEHDKDILDIFGLAEEALIHGFFMTSSAKSSSLAYSLIMSSVLFSFTNSMNSGSSLLGSVNVFMLGVFTGLCVMRRGNLWGMGAFHAAWNFTQNVVFGFGMSSESSRTSILKFTGLEGYDSLNGGIYGLQSSLIVTLILFLAIGAVLISKPNSREAVVQTPSEPGEEKK